MTQESSDWLLTIRRYLLAMALSNLVWEVLQLPFYSLWQNGTAGEIVFDVLHCTLGDLAIAAGTLAISLALAGSGGWPARRFGVVLAGCVILGMGYIVYSEYRNVVVRRAWGYSTLMPIVPGLGTGLAPFLQWLGLPSLALAWVRRKGSVPKTMGKPAVD